MTDDTAVAIVMDADAGPASAPRPATWCEHCSALGVRFTEEGVFVCWYHLWHWQLGVWAAQCADTWTARQVLETVLRAARPLDEARVVELVTYHPLRPYSPYERELRLVELRETVKAALDELVALGVLATSEQGYWWSNGARERVRG